MSNFGIGKLNTDDTHSINVSFYKPEGVSLLWSWFKKKHNSRNAATSVFNHSNNIKLKLNVDDLNKLKDNGIDLEKLQSKANSKNPMPQGNIFVIPKRHLGIKENELLNMIPNFIKRKDTLCKNNKICDRLVVATSTVSVKSKQSFVSINYKYARSNSHKSLTNSNTSTKASLRVGVKSNSKFDTQAKRFHKNILLKSVPTKIMKGNTQRKVFIPIYIGRKKTDNRENLLNKVQANEEGGDKNGTRNVIPMLIKKIKSMEEQLSDIEVTTKKINEVVSQQHILKTNSIENQEMNKYERNADSVKTIVSHKIYSKNTYCNKKSKLKQQKKPKPKIRINSNARFLDSNSNDLGPPSTLFHKKSSEYENKVNSNNEHMLDLPQQQFKFQNKFHEVSSNMVKNNFQESPEVRCEIMLKLLKALSEANNENSDAENLQETPKSINDNNISTSNEIMDLKLDSRPIFNWKHKSLSSASETRLDNHKLKDEESIKHLIKKHLSVSLKTDTNPPTRTFQTLQDLDNYEENETLETDLINKNSKDKENILISTAKSQQVVNHLINMLISEDNVNPTADTRKNSSTNIKALISETPTSKPSLTIHSEIENYTQQDLSPDTLKYTPKTRRSDFSLVEENQILNSSTLHNDMCKISIKDSTNKLKYISAPANKVTNVLKNKQKKEPKVSITIFVEDSIKDRVKMTSNLLYENELSNKLRCNDDTIIRGDGDHRGNIIESKKRICECDRKENIHTIKCIADDIVPLVFTSTKNREVINKSCPKVSFGQTNKIKEFEDLNLRNENGYLNQKQRNQYEKKLLEMKINNNKMLFSHMGQKGTSSCMDLTYSSELPRNENESFLMGQSSIYASVKHSILGNESIFSSSDPSFARKRRGPWSLESLKSHNNFDASCNFLKNDQNCSMAKQSESYDVNNSLSKEEGQPFFIVHNNENEADGLKNNNRHVLDQKRRSCRYGISIIREPIPEEIEKEMSVKETDITDLQQLEEGDNIKVKADMYNSKLLDDLDIIEFETKDLELEEPDNSNLNECRIVKSNHVNSTINNSVQSSVSVQTDWSLVGITMEHFNSDTFAKSVSTNTVSIQTDDIEPVIKQLGLPRMCKSGSNSNEQPSEIASFDRFGYKKDSTQTVIEQQNLISSEFNEENVMELKMSSVLITVSKDREPFENHSECKGYNMSIKNNCTKQKPGLIQICDGEVGDLNSSLEFINYKLQHDFKAHQCTIPCFPSLSNETVLSDISESNHTSLLSANLISDFHSAFSKMQHLKEEDNHNIQQTEKENHICPVNKVKDLYHTDKNHIPENTVNSVPYVELEEAPLTENTFMHENLPADDPMQVISDRVSLFPLCETTTNINHLDKKPCVVKVPVSDMIRNVDLYNNSYKPVIQRDLHHHNRVTTKKSQKDFVVGVYNFECESVRRGNSIFTNVADSYPLNASKTQTHIW